MKAMFNDVGEWTDESRALDQELVNALTPIAKKWHAAGYSMRDIQLILNLAAQDVANSLVCGLLE